MLGCSPSQNVIVTNEWVFGGDPPRKKKTKRKQATNYHFVRHWEEQLPTQMICCVAERPLRDPPVLKKRSFSSSMANRAQVLGSCLSLWELRDKIFDVFFKIHAHSNLKWEFGID